MRISDWSSDVCSSDLAPRTRCKGQIGPPVAGVAATVPVDKGERLEPSASGEPALFTGQQAIEQAIIAVFGEIDDAGSRIDGGGFVAEAPERLQRDRVHERFGAGGNFEDIAVRRSEEHTSELQSLMRSS